MPNLKLVARILLLIAGLGHVVPGILAPVFSIGVGVITVQMVIGVLSMILALYFLITKAP